MNGGNLGQQICRFRKLSGIQELNEGFNLLAVGELGFSTLLAAAHGVGDFQDFGEGFRIRQEARQEVTPEFSGHKPEELKGNGSGQIGPGCKGRQKGVVALGMIGQAGESVVGEVGAAVPDQGQNN